MKGQISEFNNSILEVILKVILEVIIYLIIKEIFKFIYSMLEKVVAKILLKNLEVDRLDWFIRDLNTARLMCEQSSELEKCVSSMLNKTIRGLRGKTFYRVYKNKKEILLIYLLLNKFCRIYLSLCTNSLAVSSKGSICFSNTRSTGEILYLRPTHDVSH